MCNIIVDFYSRFQDVISKKCYQAQVAFQVCVKPGSYKIAQDVIGDNDKFDIQFSNSEIAWETKDKGATQICAMLVKLN